MVGFSPSARKSGSFDCVGPSPASLPFSGAMLLNLIDQRARGYTGSLPERDITPGGPSPSWARERAGEMSLIPRANFSSVIQPNFTPSRRTGGCRAVSV